MNDRLRIFQMLNGTASPVFDILLELTNTPLGIVPPNTAPQGQRVSAFLRVATVLCFLYMLPGPQFEQLVFTFNVSSSIPGSASPQQSRVKTFVDLVYKQGQMNELVDAIYQVTGVRV